MSAVTRWVQYDVTAAGIAETGGSTNYGRGTLGYEIAQTPTGDSFNIGSNNERLWISIDGLAAAGGFISLASGTNLDPRFVAKDITEKLHLSQPAADGFTSARCSWENGRLVIYTGSLGHIGTSTVAVASGTLTAHLELGFGVLGGGIGGLTSSNANTDNYITVSGSYNGFFDEIYHVVMSRSTTIGTPTGSCGTYGGVITAGGVFNGSEDVTYTLAISTASGTTMGAGTGNVPTLEWDGVGGSSGAGYDDGGPIELLYADYWYKVGSYGLMVKFTDSIFSTCPTGWSIACTFPTQVASGAPSAAFGTAEYIWGSNRGDDATSSEVSSTSAFTPLGSRGLSIKFTAPGLANATAGDEYYVICTPPQPSAWDISNLNYGNVTVSTESPLRTVMFEILSGAVELSTVKFGLQNNGNFDHHNEGTSDTMFRFGTVGAGNNGGTSPTDGYEWWADVLAENIATDTPPYFLYATKENLSVVSDADASEDIGNSPYGGMVSDPMWLNIKLGDSEVGANSTINYRIYFDYA